MSLFQLNLRQPGGKLQPHLVRFVSGIGGTNPGGNLPQAAHTPLARHSGAGDGGHEHRHHSLPFAAWSLEMAHCPPVVVFQDLHRRCDLLGCARNREYVRKLLQIQAKRLRFRGIALHRGLPDRPQQQMQRPP